MFLALLLSCTQTQSEGKPDVCSFSFQFKKAVTSRLDTTCENINTQEITSLNLSNWPTPYTEFEDLQYFKNLEVLNLSDSKVKNLEFLYDMPGLQVLHLDHTEVIDLTPIAANTSLKELWLDQSKIQNLTALQSNTTLQELTLRNTDILNIEPLSNNKQLKVLDISSTQVQDLTPLENNTSLTFLSARETQIRDIRPLGNNKGLVLLDLRNNKIKDVHILSQLTSLAALDLGQNQIQRVPKLSKSLQEFRVDSNPIVFDDTCSQNMPKEWLHLCIPSNDNSFVKRCSLQENLPFETKTTLETLEDISNLSDCVQIFDYFHEGKIDTTLPILDFTLLNHFDLTELKINSNWLWTETCQDEKSPHYSSICTSPKISEEQKTKFIQQCKNPPSSEFKKTIQTMMKKTRKSQCTDLYDTISKQTKIDLSRMDIVDISPISFFPNIQRLYLDYNDVSDLSPLTHLPNLQVLFIDDNNISDLSPLSQNTNLLWLGLGDNKIQNISPLKDMTNLKRLWLGGNQIQDVTPLESTISLRKLHLASNQIVDISVISKLSKLENIYLADNQITNITPLYNLSNLHILNAGLDDQESPLESQHWYLQNNNITSCDMSNIRNLPTIFFCSSLQSQN